MKLVEGVSKLLGEFEGCIDGLKSKGIAPDNRTIEDYEYLSDFMQQLKDANAYNAGPFTQGRPNTPALALGMR